MSTWMDEAQSVIQFTHNRLPENATLKERQQALRDARPYKFEVTSWGQKVWQKAQREYLEQYGYVPRTPATPPKLHLSPLERMMQKAGAK